MDSGIELLTVCSLGIIVIYIIMKYIFHKIMEWIYLTMAKNELKSLDRIYKKIVAINMDILDDGEKQYLATEWFDSYLTLCKGILMSKIHGTSITGCLVEATKIANKEFNFECYRHTYTLESGIPPFTSFSHKTKIVVEFKKPDDDTIILLIPRIHKDIVKCLLSDFDKNLTKI